MLKVLYQPCGPYQVNTILVWCERTRQAALFDPAEDSESVRDEIARHDLQLRYLINTHGHLDHIAENAAVKARFRVPLLIHQLDRPMLTDPAKNLSLLLGRPIVSPDADGTLADGDRLTIGDETLVVRHLPGHSPGSLVFVYSAKAEATAAARDPASFAITGDTLFAGSIGRTDFPGGNERMLLDGIRSKILSLPETTVVYPGHGPTTTVGEERRTNPFVRF